MDFAKRWHMWRYTCLMARYYAIQTRLEESGLNSKFEESLKDAQYNLYIKACDHASYINY